MSPLDTIIADAKEMAFFGHKLSSIALFYKVKTFVVKVDIDQKKSPDWKRIT